MEIQLIVLNKDLLQFLKIIMEILNVHKIHIVFVKIEMNVLINVIKKVFV